MLRSDIVGVITLTTGGTYKNNTIYVVQWKETKQLKQIWIVIQRELMVCFISTVVQTELSHWSSGWFFIFIF